MRILRLSHIRHLPLVVAGAMALTIAGCGGGTPETASSPASAATARAASDARLTFLETRAASDPLDTFSLNNIATEHMQRARETGDVSSLARAQTALDRSLAIPRDDNYEGLALSASLSVTRHDFKRALEFASKAIAVRPEAAFAYGGLGDAHTGLGQYGEASIAYERMAAIQPDFFAFSRQALLEQINGEYEAALASWGSALGLTEGDGVPEHAAWTYAQIGNLRFILGNLDASGDAYQSSLAALPGYVHALGGLGRVEAARGDLDAAIAHYTQAIDVVPLPEYVIALGDVYAAAGDVDAAEEQYAVVDAIAQLYEANGVNTDLQIAMFNADHDRDLAATVVRAEAAFAAQPSIQAADVLAWVQYKAGDIGAAVAAIEQALRTGTGEPLILFHAGVILQAAGDDARAAEYLQRVHDRTRSSLCCTRKRRGAHSMRSAAPHAETPGRAARVTSFAVGCTA